MEKLDTPDLCARLDSMKTLCDRLEAAQDQPQKYRELVELIRIEADALRDTVCESADRGRGRKAGGDKRETKPARSA
jgi:hypothetical protein